jgi:hypothetical protein
MRPHSDLDICRDIRRVMVKHWIDLGRLSVRSTAGRVMLYGSLRRIEGAGSDLIPALVDAIMREVKHIQGVKIIRPHFENWTNEDGGWRPTQHAGAQEPSRLRHLPDPVPQERHHIPDDGKSAL